MKTLIKICGIKRLDDLECAIQNGADLIGFVFVKSSPRYIEPSSVTNLLQSVPEKIKTVAVMQHATQNSLDSILDSFKPTYIQTDADDFLSLDLPSNIKKIRVYREQENLIYRVSMMNRWRYWRAQSVVQAKWSIKNF